MIKIINKRAEKTFVTPPPSACNAEITLDEDGKILYIHVCDWAITSLTVGEKSIYDYMTQKVEETEEFEFLEEYEDIDEAKKSKYAEYFDMALAMIDEL